jgi:proline iminopeptidase
VSGLRYPPVEPNESGWLAVGDGHEIYWEMVGDPDGVPVVLLHGGPGAGCGGHSRRWFDPAVHRAVLFDQRGCGRSRPLADSAAADLRTNTTDHLIADIEALRTHLSIERWTVVGLSWGVTLGLAYAQRHAERVSRMVLAAVTAGRRFETEWITRGMRRVFPREWEQFASLVPEAERGGDLAAAYARLLANPDPAVSDEAALAWCRWEDTHVSLATGVEPDLQLMPAQERQVFARLVTHYWSQGCFLDDTPILCNMEAIERIPAVLIHGQYDVSSPLDTAWDLHQRWPAAELRVLADAGHGGSSMIDEMVRVINPR